MERLNAVLPIRDIFSRVILNCCGQSALETDVLAGEDVVGRVSVPGNGREDPDVRADAEYINTVIAGSWPGKIYLTRSGSTGSCPGLNEEERLCSVCPPLRPQRQPRR